MNEELLVLEDYEPKVFNITNDIVIHSIRFQYLRTSIFLRERTNIRHQKSVLYIHNFNDGNVVIFKDKDREHYLLIPKDQFCEISDGFGFLYGVTHIISKKLKVSYRSWYNRWC